MAIIQTDNFHSYFVLLWLYLYQFHQPVAIILYYCDCIFINFIRTGGTGSLESVGPLWNKTQVELAGGTSGSGFIELSRDITSTIILYYCDCICISIIKTGATSSLESVGPLRNKTQVELIEELVGWVFQNRSDRYETKIDIYLQVQLVGLVSLTG